MSADMERRCPNEPRAAINELERERRVDLPDARDMW